MDYVVRVSLLSSEAPRGRGRINPVQQVLDCYEVEVHDKREGVEILDEVGKFLEDEFDLELLEEQNGREDNGRH